MVRSSAVRSTSFEVLAAKDDASLGIADIAMGAALIARDVYGTLDVPALLDRFDELAAPLEGRGLKEQTPRAQAESLGRHLYETCGFAGNEEDYYDPKNSLLPDVLDRRLGIPISLAVVYCEVARRLGIEASGVGFPGHFLVRIEDPGKALPIVVDPFFRGRVLDGEGLTKLLHRVTGKNETFRPELLQPAKPRAILLRMLVNLRTIYLSRGDMARAMLAIDRILCLTPDAPEALRERGLLSARLGANAAALADLERFLVVAPGAEDASQIRARITELRARGSRSVN
jgi:regulator of sirC expression with transglutaminase-like and TPR domain